MNDATVVAMDPATSDDCKVSLLIDHCSIIFSVLPLFATGLGALGLLGWRRKRNAQAAA